MRGDKSTLPFIHFRNDPWPIARYDTNSKRIGIDNWRLDEGHGAPGRFIYRKSLFVIGINNLQRIFCHLREIIALQIRINKLQQEKFFFGSMLII